MTIAQKALDRAGENLKVLQRALLMPDTKLDALLALLKSVAEDLGYSHFVRWANAELGGYKEGRLGDIFGVAEGDSLPEQVSSYRLRKGAVTLAFSNGKTMELPYRWFFTDPLGKLEETAALNAENPQMVVVTIPAAKVTHEFIRQFIEERTDDKKLIVTFSGFVYAQILMGLRGQVVNAASELASAHKMLNDSLSWSGSPGSKPTN